MAAGVVLESDGVAALIGLAQQTPRRHRILAVALGVGPDPPQRPTATCPRPGRARSAGRIRQ